MVTASDVNATESTRVHRDQTDRAGVGGPAAGNTLLHRNHHTTCPFLLTYLLPLHTADDDDLSELATYLRAIADHIDDVIVVDGSSAEAIAEHRVVFDDPIRVVATEHRTPMGKVGNVLTGIEHARHENVVIADDDVRYTVDQLRDIGRRLGSAAIVRPQNYFVPLLWHARVDTARTLLARVAGGDWPGTLGVRRSLVLEAGGYAGDVMFENLELVRTVRAAGGREHVALDLTVARRPPTTAHFARQQIRQAYDELARPARFAASLLVLPLCTAAVLGRRWRPVVGATVGVTVAAEAGRRRAGGRSVFPASSSLLASPWLVWRSACSWAALVAYTRGGVKYRGTRLRRAATPMRVLRNANAKTTGPERSGT